VGLSQIILKPRMGRQKINQQKPLSPRPGLYSFCF
jgi:hypothetical protein